MSGERYVRLTEDMRAIIASERLGFAATVTADGRPNLSPKGTIRVWDDHTLAFLDLASPGTRENLAANHWMELNVVEQLSRRGYRFYGRAELHLEGSAIYDEATRRVFGEEGSTYPVTAVVLIAIDRAAPLLSPAYWQVGDETAIRTMWRERRAALDREFELHLARVGPVTRKGAQGA